jgi:serine phosphatase RsbU (regulator of sigma subunit)
MIKFFLKRILFFSLLILSELISAQESAYYIRNYSPKEYDGFDQMWQAVQDKNGVIYFAGTSNVFIYDGTSFQSVPVKSGSANRQIAIDSATGIIYVGAVGEFGYLERDSVNGKMVFKSLTKSLDEKQKVFSDIWKIQIANGKIYFQAGERIFICKGKKVVGTIEASTDKTFALLFQSQGKLFVRQRNVGLEEIIDDQLHITWGGERFATSRILGIMPWKFGDNLVLTGDSGFFLMNKGQVFESAVPFRPFTPTPDTFLINHSVLGCKWVNDSTFAVYTRSGIGFYNQQGRLKECLNKSSGLADESIAEILVDRQKNIWLMHNGGMSRLCYNTPALYYTDKTGYSGNIEIMLRYKGKLFLGTTEGLFEQSDSTFDAPDKMKFSRVESIPQTEVWELHVFNGILFASTTFGLFYQAEEKFECISNATINRIIESPYPNQFIAVEKGGFAIYNFTPGKKPELIKHFNLPGEDIIRIGAINSIHGKEGSYKFWCANRFKNMINASFNLADTNVLLQYYDSANGLPLVQVYPLRIGDSTYFVSPTQAYRFYPSLYKGPKSHCFFPAPDIFEKIFTGNYTGIKSPFDFQLMFQNESDPLSSCYGYDAEKKLYRQRIPIAYCFGGEEIQYTYMEQNGISWLMSGNIILRFNRTFSPPTDVNFITLVSRVTIGIDSVIFFGSDSASNVHKDALPYKFNSISFNFSAPYFEFDREMQYFYKLEGFDTGWVQTKKSPEKYYTNLPEGTYTFKVKALSLLNRTSTEGSFTFTILPPWYRTGFAYFLYTLGFIFGVMGLVRLAVRRIRLQKEKLEIIVQERTAEVVEQKHKIEDQNHKLEDAYKGMRDSIHYAQRIQEAILPVQSGIHESFPDSFIFFRPRDIVSGDFYWFIRRQNKSFIACVDCTGHGVPGAFMSMIGNTLLNEIVLEKNIEDPDLILDLLHVRIRQALHQDSGGETRDGMDIAICVINHSENKLQYAGANRPFWLIRDGNLIEIKPNKFSIAGDQEEEKRKFTPHEIEIKKGDCIYLSSDGYADQFGGERGKKLMVKNFQKHLLEIYQLPMEKQGTYLENLFYKWKGSLEQVDDVLVIGLRV